MKTLGLLSFFFIILMSCSKDNMNDELLSDLPIDNAIKSYLSFKIYSEEDGEIFFQDKLTDLRVEHISNKIRLHFDDTYFNSFKLQNILTLIEGNNGLEIDPNNTLILLGYMYAEENETGVRKDITNNSYIYNKNENKSEIKINFSSKCFTHGSTNCSTDWSVQNGLNNYFNKLEKFEQNLNENLTVSFELFIDKRELN